GVDPQLALRGDYGGLTQTMALFTGSPAINAVTSGGAPATDQRGFSRVGAADIGAFEAVPMTLVVHNTTDNSGPGSFTNLSLRQAVRLANILSDADTITFDPTVFATPKTITLTSGKLILSSQAGLTTIIAPAAGV